MRGDRMYQLTNNYLRRFGERCDPVVCHGRCGLRCGCCGQKNRHVSCVATLLLLTLTAHPILAQEKSSEALKGINAGISASPPAQQQTAASPTKRSIAISDAVSIFLQQNLQLVAGRYDIDTADAEKLTARLRPNPEFSFTSQD